MDVRDYIVDCEGESVGLEGQRREDVGYIKRRKFETQLEVCHLRY